MGKKIFKIYPILRPILQTILTTKNENYCVSLVSHVINQGEILFFV